MALFANLSKRLIGSKKKDDFDFIEDIDEPNTNDDNNNDVNCMLRNQTDENGVGLFSKEISSNSFKKTTFNKSVDESQYYNIYADKHNDKENILVSNINNSNQNVLNKNLSDDQFKTKSTIKSETKESEEVGEVEDYSIEEMFSKVRHNRSEYVLNALDSNLFDIDTIDQKGNTIIHICCQNNHRKLLFTILQKYPTININKKNFKSLTPLDYCNKYEFIKMSEWLVSKGAVHGMSLNDNTNNNSNTNNVKHQSQFVSQFR